MRTESRQLGSDLEGSAAKVNACAAQYLADDAAAAASFDGLLFPGGGSG